MENNTMRLDEIDTKLRHDLADILDDLYSMDTAQGKLMEFRNVEQAVRIAKLAYKAELERQGNIKTKLAY